VWHWEFTQPNPEKVESCTVRTQRERGGAMTQDKNTTMFFTTAFSISMHADYLLKICIQAVFWWLMPVILATQEAKITSSVHKTLSRKYPSQKKGLVEWLKVKNLSSGSSITKKKKSIHIQ
jgi:hypothetical protein